MSKNGGSLLTFDLIRPRFDSKAWKENNTKLPYVRIRLLSLSEDFPHVVNEGVMHPEHGVPGGELDDVHVPTHPVVHAIMMNLGVETYIKYRAMSDIQWTVPQLSIMIIYYSTWSIFIQWIRVIMSGDNLT